jgi:hypothetical protein
VDERQTGARVIRVHRDHRVLHAAAGLAALLLLSGCPGGPERIDAGASYPQLGEARPTRDQRTALVISTATFMDFNLADDEGSMLRHTGYTVYTDRGEKVLYVRNFLGSRDTQPTTVELEPGPYLILLDNPEKQAPVFKVMIESGKLTTVTLPK